jgi:hypothetical protein
MSEDGAAAADHADTLREWRERGADRVDPVRFGFIEGLVRRAAMQSGAARQLLDGRIAGLMASYAEAVARVPVAAVVPVQALTSASALAQSLAGTAATTLAPARPPASTSASAHAPEPAPSPAPARTPTHTATHTRAVAPATARVPAASGQARTPARPTASPPALPTAPRGPLGALADLINQRAPTAAGTTVASDSSSTAPAFPAGELKALDEVRNTWARLDAEQRLEQALAQVPANAGPLNSYQLVLRTLILMRDVSPEYLQRFMTHVDALLWLERTAP